MRLLPPNGALTHDEAIGMARELITWPLLDGFRGRPKADVNALADAIVAFSRMTSQLGERLIEAEANPVFVLPEGQGVRAADGVVAYSGVCTHTGCDVTDWFGDTLHFKCPCHESEFDPGDGARVVGGPAPLPLAALPLKLVDGALVVASPFQGRVGFQALDPFSAAPPL